MENTSTCIGIAAIDQTIDLCHLGLGITRTSVKWDLVSNITNTATDLYGIGYSTGTYMYCITEYPTEELLFVLICLVF